MNEDMSESNDLFKHSKSPDLKSLIILITQIAGCFTRIKLN